MAAAASLSAVGGQTNGDAGTAVFSNTLQFVWLKPASAIFHGTERLEWTADAVDPRATTADIVLAGKDAFTLATGQFPISSLNWDTTTVADRRYDLQLVYRDSTGAILNQLPRSILVNNSIAWHSGVLQGNQTWTADRVNGLDGNVIVPSGVTLMAGNSAKIGWTITNIGSEPAIGPWHDDVYLLRDPDTDPVEIFAGDVLSGQGVTLGPGQSYSGSATIRVPGSVVGNHRWEVKTNARGDVFEGQNTANNTGISPDTVSLDLPELTPGAAPLPYTFASAGQSWWYKIAAGAGHAVETDLALASNYVWTFTTAAAPILTQPTVISTIPLNAATGVPLNQIVSATFSTAMNPASISSATFKLTGPGATAVPGLVAYAAVGNTLTFVPTANLAPSTLFTATITTGAQNLAGTALASNYVWTFTTGAAVVVTPPELVSTVPANAATAVPLNQAVSATFSKAMNPLTTTTGTFQLAGPGDTAIAGTVSYDAINFIATFTPTALLTASTTYTATVTNGATDLAGNPLGTTGPPNPWTFTTGAAAIPPPVVLGPTITLFGVFGGTAGTTNQGIYTVINGDIGTTAVSTKITGFHDESVPAVAGVYPCTYTETPLNIGLVNGAIDTAPPPPTVGCPNEGTAVTSAAAAQAALDALTAYNTLAAIPNGLDVSLCPGCGGGSAGELGNRTLAPGIYKAAPGSYAISLGDLTLDAKGDPNAFWVFQMATTLTVGTPSSNRNVLLVNGAQAKKVFWQVGTAATINGILGGGTMQGTIIAQSGISISTAGVAAVTTINGRALVLVGPVTMVNTVINTPAP